MMAHNSGISPTHQLLGKPLSKGTCASGIRRSVARAMFQIDSESHKRPLLNDLDAYFKYWYDDQCRQCAQQVSAYSHADILEIISFLRERDASYSSVLAKLRQTTYELRQANDQKLKASITLATRLFSVINIGKIEGHLPPGDIIQWSCSPDKSIKDQVNRPFSKNFEPHEAVKLPKLFNAMNLEKIAGIKVCWSSNLAEHLLMKEDETQVTLFHQASFLRLHQSSSSGLLDVELIEETLTTLALLLPKGDNDVQAWFAKMQRNLRKEGMELDSQASQCGHLRSRARNIEKFKFWRDRLVALKQAFDASEPRSLGQLWSDDRKKVGWYTFWVAVVILLLTIVFGVLQTATGIVQAWAAIKSLRTV